MIANVLVGDMNKALYKDSSEFEQLKTLEGEWGGKGKMGAIETPDTVEFKVTSNSSALVERLFAGTSQGMATVYTDKDSKVSLTHYFSVSNLHWIYIASCCAGIKGDHHVPSSGQQSVRDICFRWSILRIYGFDHR